MNFRKATDALLESVTLEDLANALGVSVQSVRQARVAEESTAHRSPPIGWEKAAIRLSEEHMRRHRKLVERLSNITERG